MIEVSYSKFKENIYGIVDKVITDHMTIRIKRRSGKDFILISAVDWEREQETLFVLSNKSLMNQIAESLVTYENGSGYKPTQQQLDEINNEGIL